METDSLKRCWIDSETTSPFSGRRVGEKAFNASAGEGFLEDGATTPVLLLVLEQGLDPLPLLLVDCACFWEPRGMVEGATRGGTAKEKK
jgi:hypothetical protein